MVEDLRVSVGVLIPQFAGHLREGGFEGAGPPVGGVLEGVQVATTLRLRGLGSVDSGPEEG